MKKIGILMIALGLFLALPSLLSVASAVTNADTFTNVISGNAMPQKMPIWHYNSSGAYQAVSPNNVSYVTVDNNTIIWPEALSTSGNSTFQWSASPLTQGLVGYWPLGEKTSGTCTGSVYDLSHENNTGTCSGSPVYTTLNGDGAINFTSTSSSSEISTTGTLTLSSLSISMIFKSTGSSFDSTQNLLLFGYGQDNMKDSVEVKLEGSLLIARYHNDANSPILTEAITYTPGSEELLTATFTTSQFCFYVNATQEGCGIPSGSYVAQAYALYTAQEFAGSSPYNRWIGANFRTYSSTLSPSEISELYTSTIPQIENTSLVNGNYNTHYWEQIPQTIYAGSSYRSLGQTLVSSITGTYWVDVSPALFVNPSGMDLLTFLGTIGISLLLAGIAYIQNRRLGLVFLLGIFGILIPVYTITQMSSLGGVILSQTWDKTLQEYVNSIAPVWPLVLVPVSVIFVNIGVLLSKLR